jgi:hypothetical protein
VATGELFAIRFDNCSRKSKTRVCNLKSALNPDCVAGKIPLRFIMCVKRVKKSFSFILRKTSRSEIGRVAEGLQTDSFFARRRIRVSFQCLGKIASEKDRLNILTRSDQ